MNAKLVQRHIKQVRSEMRFNQVRQTKIAAAKLAKEMIEELDESIGIYIHRNRAYGIQSIDHVKLIRELTKLTKDLTTYSFEPEELGHMMPDASKLPILSALKELCRVLKLKPIDIQT